MEVNMGGVGQISLARALQAPRAVALDIQSAEPGQLAILLQTIVGEDPDGISVKLENGDVLLSHALQREAAALIKANAQGDVATIEWARARFLALLQPSSTPAVGQAVLFAEPASAAAKLNKVLATRFYRPSRLYLSPALGGGSIPIRPGISDTVPIERNQGPRVLFVSLFPMGSNGSATYTQAVANYVATRGGEARILHVGHRLAGSLGVAEYLVPFTPERGEPLEGAAMANFPVLDSNPGSPNGKRFKDMTPVQIRVYTGAIADAVAEAARHMKPDVIVVNHAWVGAEAARRTHLPYVVVCHGTCSTNMRSALEPSNGSPSNLQNLVFPGVRGADRVIAITADVASEVADAYGVSPGRIVVIPNGFNANIFFPKEVERDDVLRRFGISTDGITHLVSFAGRMVDYKGVATLLRAAQRVIASMPGVHFVLAGDGKEKAQFESLAGELGIANNVHFIGQRTLEELADLHRIADIGVVPSAHEPSGIVPLEMAGVGTPVIATAVGGLRQTVTPEVGVQVPPQNPLTLAEAIEKALRDNLKAQIGGAASKHVHTHHPWEGRGAELVDQLEEIIASRRRGTRPRQQVGQKR